MMVVGLIVLVILAVVGYVAWMPFDAGRVEMDCVSYDDDGVAHISG